MDKLIYERGESSKEPQKIVFELSPDLTLGEFKQTCARLASALGYNSDRVRDAFGQDIETGDPNQLKLLLD